MSDEKTYRCPASLNGDHCDYRGTHDQLDTHANELGHPRCQTCPRILRAGETGCCSKCLQRTRDALHTIMNADLEPVVEATALHPGTLPGGNALVMLADGNAEALRPYKPKTTESRSKPTAYPPMAGQQHTHPAYLDLRPQPDGKEHYADHWPTDPLVPLPLLEQIVRTWRRELGEPLTDAIYALGGCCHYLLARLELAALEVSEFEDNANDLQRLAIQVANTAGTVNHPVIAEVACFDCGDKLISAYAEPKLLGHRRRLGLPSEGREMVDTDDGTPMPVWSCRGCDREYSPAEYWLAVRAALEEQAEKAG